MMNCQKAKDLVREVLDGTIDDDQLDALKSHAKTCPACRAEFERCGLIEELVKDAFSPRTAAEEARAQILARLSAQPDVASHSARIIRLSWAGSAIAAGILVAIGLFAGFVLARTDLLGPRRSSPTAQVPIRVGNVEGTVVVRHEGADTWQMLNDGVDLYLGDTFHSAAGARFVLELPDNKSTIAVNQNSMLALTSYDGETQFFLEHGECTASLESPHGPFFIRTPHGRVEALGTEFTVTVE